MLTESTVKRLNNLIDQNRERILSVADYIWKNPEPGYREWKTSQFMQQQFTELGYTPILMDNIPGFYADLDSGRPGPTLAILGELDAIICPEHPDADPETGAVHACGHHTQSAYLVGVASVLRDPDILAEISGKIRFIAVPAEELVEREYRSSLIEQGIISYLGGKIEFLYRGVFDNVDAAVMIHSGTASKSLEIVRGSNGHLLQRITFTGKSAHASSASSGVNALYAASLGLQAINSIRETFLDENTTRVHPVIISASKASNVIPETVKLDSAVRGLTIEAIMKEAKKVNRALTGAALSLGARVQVRNYLGYMPRRDNDTLDDIMLEVANMMVGEENICNRGQYYRGKGCTDMGDISSVMPVIHPSNGGGIGAAHASDFRIVNPEIACLDSARCIAGFACALLGGDGSRLRDIKEKHQPIFASYSDYFAFRNSIDTDQELIHYNGDTVTATWGITTEKAKLLFTGDIMCYKDQIDICKTGESYDFSAILAAERKYLADSDYLIGNLETPLAGADAGYASNDEIARFNAPDEFAVMLKGAGFNLVSTANNHCMDKGMAGIVRTRDVLEKVGIVAVGTARSEPERGKSVIKEINGIRVGFAASTYGTNSTVHNMLIDRDKRYLVNLYQPEYPSDGFIRNHWFLNNNNLPERMYELYDLPNDIYDTEILPLLETIQADISNLRSDRAEYIVYLLHSGGQYNPWPDALTLRMTEFIRNAGADAIIVNHPHVIHPLKIVKGCLVAYSLGNFIFTPDTGVMQMSPDHEMVKQLRPAYSILLELQLLRENGIVRLDSVDFSVHKSVFRSDGHVVTIPVYDLFVAEKDEAIRQVILADNAYCVNKFSGILLDNDVPMQSKYNFQTLVETT